LEGLQEEQELLDLVVGESIEENIETSAGANVVGVAGFGDRVASTDGVWLTMAGDDQYLLLGDVKEPGQFAAVLRLWYVETA